MSLLYERIANSISALIQSGVYPPGARLPSVRDLSHNRSVSVSTSVRVYHELERRGSIESRPQAGFYVVSSTPLAGLPGSIDAVKQPMPVTGQDRIMRMLQAVNDPAIVNFGAATPHPEFLPGVALERSYKKAWRSNRRRCLSQEFAPGCAELRTQIARRLASIQTFTRPEDILITNGCQESVSIALRLVTQPGDVVAIESPTFYGLLEVIRGLGLRALEIPTSPESGLSLEALELAATEWSLKACVVIPNYSNPLGVSMSNDKKKRLIAMAEQFDFSIVEDDIYGEIPAKGNRLLPIKSWDDTGRVLYCSSATKTVSAGLRIGWLVPGAANMARAIHLQYVSTISVETVGQLALADYFSNGQINRHMRKMAREYDHSRVHLLNEVEKLFPEGSRISRPSGGFVLWIELPGNIDTAELMNEALEDGICFAPGTLFSASGRFTNCLRLNSAQKWEPRIERALVRLAKLIN